MVGRCPCRGWRATMVHGRAEIGWLKMVTVQLSTFYFHTSIVSRTGMGGGAHISHTEIPSPCALRETTSPSRGLLK